MVLLSSDDDDHSTDVEPLDAAAAAEPDVGAGEGDTALVTEPGHGRVAGHGVHVGAGQGGVAGRGHNRV